MQNKQNNNNKKPVWQEPDPGSAQKFITPEAEKSMREGAGRYRVVRMGAPQRTEKKTSPNRKNGAKPKEQSLAGAIKDELKDRLNALGLGISVDSEDIIKGCIIAGFMIFFALMQTTFFARLTPFGAIPDLMLAFTAAVAQNEGEKWGGVCGLIAAFVIQSLGGIGTFPHVLPLLYMPIGYVVGILSVYYFSSSIPVKIMYILGCGVLRMIFTAVVAAVSLSATPYQIAFDMVIPEFFSTVLLTPIVYFLVYIGTKHFHKTRAERTDSTAEHL